LECIVTALKNGRVGDENICVRTHDAALALGQAKQAGESSRLQTERIWLTVESGTQDLVLAVETAYWGLVQARDTLASREDAVRTTEEEAATVKARYDEKLLTRQDVDTMTEQRHLARVELIDAQAQVRTAELNLRRTAGLPPDDGCSLVPCDEPDRLPPLCDSKTDLEQARMYRPELALARLAVEAACQEYVSIKDVKVHPLAKLKTPGEQEIAQAKLKVQREQVALRDAEEQTVFALQTSQRQVAQAWQSLVELVAREAAARRRLEAVTEKWQSKEFGELRELIQARAGVTTARRDTSQALTQYQIARADLLRRKGMLLQHHRVCVDRPPRKTPGD
jgi:outer membrane protein TolC